MKDPLDDQIDALLASQPIRPADDFAARVLAQTEAEATPVAKRPLAIIMAFTLPLAAAIVVTLSVLRPDSGQGAGPETPVLSAAEAQEIFLLEESLASLATFESTDFASGDLLATLDALYLEI